MGGISLDQTALQTLTRFNQNVNLPSPVKDQNASLVRALNQLHSNGFSLPPETHALIIKRMTDLFELSYDGMRSDTSNWPETSSYSRADYYVNKTQSNTEVIPNLIYGATNNDKRIFFGTIGSTIQTNKETNQIIRRLEKEGNLIRIGDVNSLQAERDIIKKKNYIFLSKISDFLEYEEISKKIAYFFHTFPDNTAPLIILELLLGKNISCLKYYSKDRLAENLPAKLTPHLLPIQKQDVFEALSNLGVYALNRRFQANLPALTNTLTPNNQSLPELIAEMAPNLPISLSDFRDKDARKYIRKNRLLEHSEALFSKTQSNYEKLFSIGEYKPLTHLTRSGLSAMIASIDTAKEIIKRNGSIPTAFIGKGTYFEFTPPKDLQLAYSPKDYFNMLILDYSPSSPTYIENYSEYFEEKVNHILSLAAQFPQEMFSIIIDKTCNPQFHLFNDVNNIPHNVAIIEHGSTTKYQKGVKNYHFGFLSFFANNTRLENDFQTCVPNVIESSFGELSDRGKLHYPRLTHDYLDRILNTFSLQNHLFSETFSKVMNSQNFPNLFTIQSNLAPEYKYADKVQRLLPPILFVYPNFEKVIQATGFSADCYTPNNPLRDALNELTTCWNLEDLKPSFEIGESFGLRNMRAKAYYKNPLPNLNPNKPEYLPYIRVALPLVNSAGTAYGEICSVIHDAATHLANFLLPNVQATCRKYNLH